jgi:hypothetical protein
MRARSILRFACAHALALALAASASAVIIDSDDGTGNATEPVPAPGWSWKNVGVRSNGLTGVYLGGSFVLTANHVGPGDIVLDGVTYTYVPGTAVQLDNGDDPVTYADLLMFQIYPEPPLPALAISSIAPPPLPTTQLVLVGHGTNRGDTTTWDPPGDDGPHVGYWWGAGQSMRWGTNRMDGLPFLLAYPQPNPTLFTMAFATDFDEPGPTQTEHECQASVGDSGGATFASTPTTGWELAGILFVIGAYQGQPGGTALYGNETASADLSSYREQILGVMALPEPSGGRWPGVAAVALLARRRQSFTRSSTRR